MRYQLIDLDKSLQRSPPPTTRPRSVRVGSAIIVESAPLEAADACHGGDFVFCGSFRFPPEPYSG